MKKTNAVLLAVLLMAAWSPLNPIEPLQPSPVLADDDDDDDDGGGVGGGGGGQ